MEPEPVGRREDTRGLSIFEQAGRYLVVGAIATGIDWSLFKFAVDSLAMHHTIAAALSVIAGAFASYLLSTRFVFAGGRFSRPVELFLVYSVSLAGLVLNVVFMALLVDGMAFDPMTAKILATCSLFVYNFVVRRRFIFAPESSRPAPRRSGSARRTSLP